MKAGAPSGPVRPAFAPASAALARASCPIACVYCTCMPGTKGVTGSETKRAKADVPGPHARAAAREGAQGAPVARRKLQAWWTWLSRQPVVEGMSRAGTFLVQTSHTNQPVSGISLHGNSTPLRRKEGGAGGVDKGCGFRGGNTQLYACTEACLCRVAPQEAAVMVHWHLCSSHGGFEMLVQSLQGAPKGRGKVVAFSGLPVPRA